MKLTKYNSMSPAHTFEQFIDNIFNHNISDFVGSDYIKNVPSVNIVETTDNFAIEMAAPGLAKEDFEISFEEGYLKVAAQKEEEKVEDGQFMRREFSFNSFVRSFKMPHTVDTDKIDAKYVDGVLTIFLPKKEEVKKAELKKMIKVK